MLARMRSALPFILTLAGGGYLLLLTGRFDHAARGGRIGPEVWPRIILGLMLAAAFVGLLIVLFGAREGAERTLERLSGRQSTPDVEAAGATAGASLPDVRPSLAGVGALILYVAGLGIVGFVPATFLLMLVIILLGGYGRPGRAALIALIGALAFFVVFQRLVYVSLPLGVEPFRSLSIGLMALIGVK